MALTWEGCVQSPPVRQILVLMPGFDREFAMTFQGPRLVRGENEFNFVFNEGLCLLRE